MAFGERIGAYGAWLLLLSNFFATMAIAVPAGIYTLALLAPAHEQDPVWAAAVGRGLDRCEFGAALCGRAARPRS